MHIRSAAREADALFVRCPGGVKGDLAKYCDKYEIDYLPFSSFLEVRSFTCSINVRSDADISRITIHRISGKRLRKVCRRRQSDNRRSCKEGPRNCRAFVMSDVTFKALMLFIDWMNAVIIEKH